MRRLLRQGMTTPKAMRDVIYALLPATGASLWFFGLSAVLILGSCIAGAILAEWLFADRQARGESLRDATAILTGLLLGLTLPPGLPLWMAFLGGFVAISLGKVIWGGLGHNLFNPALLGRAFLLATFPIAMTTWVPASDDGGFISVYSSNLALPFMQAPIDGVTAATPLGMMKFDQEVTPLANLMFGKTSGSLGETSGLLLLLGGIYLWLRRDLDWRIPVSILLTVVIFLRCLEPVRRGAISCAAVLGFLRRPVARGDLHGDRPGDLAGHPARRVDIRHRRRRPRDVDPGLRRPPRGSDVRDPVNERGDAADRSIHAAPGVRSRGRFPMTAGAHTEMPAPARCAWCSRWRSRG